METSQSIERFVSHFARHGLGCSAASLMTADEDLWPLVRFSAPEPLDVDELVDAPGDVVWDGFFYPERW